MKIKIDSIDRRIIYELDLNSRISDFKLAKKVNRSRSSVRYRINELIKNNIIKKFTLVTNFNKLGYQVYKIYLTIGGDSKKIKEFHSFLSKKKNLIWLGVAEGAWNLGITFFAKSHLDFYDIRNEILTNFGDLILSKKVGMVVNLFMSPKSFLIEDKNYTAPLNVFGNVEYNVLDLLDEEIIVELQNNSRISFVDLSKKLNSTVDIIKSRIKKLEDKNIILRYSIDINYSLLDYELYKTFIYFKIFSKETELKLFNYCNENPNIINYIHQIFDFDIAFEVVAENFKQYNLIIQNIKREFSDDILKIETSILSDYYAFSHNY
jgi:DNA-binding Lrp family transcriptional regulator